MVTGIATPMDETVQTETAQTNQPAESDEGFPIEEGWFQSEEGGRGIRRCNHDKFKIGGQPAAESLWRAKQAKGDYHAPMTDVKFMDWLKHHLTPSFEEQFGKDMKMILVLDNASYHHGFDPEVRVPGTNSKKYNTGLLRKNGVDKIAVMRRVDNGNGGVKDCEFCIEVPAEGAEFPQAISKDGVSKAEVAKATRAYFEEHDSTKLIERMDKFMQDRRWELTWTPPYMPSFQPVELFW